METLYQKGYCIQKRWGVYTKKDTGVYQKGYELYPKKWYTKETITKDMGTGFVRDYFYASYQQSLKTPYVADFGKDGRIFKDLLAGVPADELKSLIDRFFASEDKFIKEAGYTIGVFKSQINKLRGKNGTDKYAERTETLEV